MTGTDRPMPAQPPAKPAETDDPEPITVTMANPAVESHRLRGQPRAVAAEHTRARPEDVMATVRPCAPAPRTLGAACGT